MATMTNSEIITRARIELMEAGKIGTTGRILTVNLGGGETKSFPEPEEIHTYGHWKSMGYQVRKGEKAIAELMIWKYGTRKQKAEDSEEDGGNRGGRCFMKRAFFFKPDQVEKIKREVA